MARGCATPEALLSNTLSKGLQPDFRSLDPARNKLKTAVVAQGRSARRAGRTIVEGVGAEGPDSRDRHSMVQPLIDVVAGFAR
jgi:hypothetical protein